MNINLGIEQSVGVSQQLNLAPQLLQWLKLLQVSNIELSDMVQGELETNPALEIDDGAKQEKAADEDTHDSQEEIALTEKEQFLAKLDDDWKNDTEGITRKNNSASDYEQQEKYDFSFNSISSSQSLSEYLMNQLHLLDLPKRELVVAEIIIGSINERGYIEISLNELSIITTEPLNMVSNVLSKIQAMEPTGIGARDLRECLLLQLADTEENYTARQIVQNHLEALAHNQYLQIAAVLGVNEEEVLNALSLIKSLNPAPGQMFEKTQTQYINPDVIITKQDGEYSIENHDSYIPHLRISASCRRLLNKDKITASELAYIRRKIRSATFLIQGIGQRQETLRRVTEQIIKFQREYLDSPKGKLQPLTMAKVAGIIGVHETTISRALANKHIETPRGLFEMKHFFRPGYQCADGSFITPEDVKELIADMVDNELPSSPLRDIDIADKLKEKGMKLARRTIAKYRTELDIPSSKERKQSESKKFKKETIKLAEPVENNIEQFAVAS